MTISAHAYAEIQKWLIKSRIDSCERDDAGTWVCKLTRESLPSAWILWNEDHNLKFDAPKAWQIQSCTKLSGDRSACSGGALDIGEIPIMVEGPPIHR